MKFWWVFIHAIQALFEAVIAYAMLCSVLLAVATIARCCGAH